MPPLDYSWSETALHACRCGTVFPAQRWRWIDVVHNPGTLRRVRRQGPWDGTCPECSAPAAGHAGWLEVDPNTSQATLVLHAARRGDVIEELQAHLGRVQTRGETVPLWLLHPTPRFSGSSAGERPRPEETTARRSVSPPPSHAQDEEQAGAAQPTEQAEQTDVRRQPKKAAPASAPSAEATPSREASVVTNNAATPTADSSAAVGSEVAAEESAPPQGPDAGVPQLIGTDSPSPDVAARRRAIGAYVADLTLDDVVTFRVRATSEALVQWENAHLTARPIHLRTRGYPLVGVRVVGSCMGQVGCIDAVVDVGSTLATDVFRRLSESFEVTLYIEHGSREVSRVIREEGLEPNAALCIESARGILARGEYPPQEFDNARCALEAEPAEVRLAPPSVSLASGAYRHIIGAREAVAALEHLERVSQKETLARLLEVDGLPMSEYDEIRRRVLEGSLTYGLCAPRRFWRRLVASGLARDLEDYAQRLCANRATYEGEEGDLDAEAAREAWVAIHELCRRKDLVPPPALRKALDLPEPPASPPPLPPRQAAGEIRSGEIVTESSVGPAAPSPSEPLGQRLHNPNERLRAATEVLQGRASLDDLGQVISALEEFETNELLALLPDLNELGPRVVPALLEKLRSERREVRQAAAILLGMAREPDAMQHLAEHLVREPTTVWLDVARAIGWYGTAAIRSLCQVLAEEAGTAHEAMVIDRVARAMAEVAVSQGSGQNAKTGREAVRALSDAADPRVSTAARRAMSSISEVTTCGAQIRGEIPLSDITEIRAFARRAYEAIMVPELEVEAEA